MQNVVPKSGNIKPLAGRTAVLFNFTNQQTWTWGKHNFNYLTSQNGYVKLFCASILSHL